MEVGLTIDIDLRTRREMGIEEQQRRRREWRPCLECMAGNILMHWAPSKDTEDRLLLEVVSRQRFEHGFGEARRLRWSQTAISQKC